MSLNSEGRSKQCISNCLDTWFLISKTLSVALRPALSLSKQISILFVYRATDSSCCKVNAVPDGDAAFAKATGLTLDLNGKGLGLRANRFSMLVKDGKVVTLNVEGPGKFEVSDAATLLGQAKA